MKKLLLFCLLAELTFFVRGQNYIDLFKADFASTPQNKFDTSNASTSLTEINSDLTIPFPIKDNLAILSGLTYEMTSASFDPGRSIETLTGLTLKLGVNVKYNSKWSGTYLLLPKTSSDLQKSTNQNFQLGGAVLMKYAKSDHFNYRFGMYANSELFGPFIVPIFGLYYLNSTEKFEAKVLLPLSVDLNYAITANAKLGLNFKGQIRTYNLHTPIDAETNRYAARSTNDIYFYFRYGMNNGINLQVGVGRSIGRSYRIYDDDVSFALPLAYFGDQREQLNTDFSDSWLFKVAAFYRLKL